MNFTVDYFRDEVRNGFYIPTAIKQGWAAGLVVLGEIDRICKKHDIEYFADWGTFLGAVRHGGFVPWDDDLDICMKRDDYEKIRSVADIELPKEFVIHDYERKEDHQLFIARIVNNSQISFDEKHLAKYHNFPYMASVDIFILDYLYNDEDEERKRCDEIKRLIAVADGIYEGKLHKDTINHELYDYEKKYNLKIDRNLDKRQLMIELYKIAEKQMARAPKDESNRIGQIFPWVLKGSKGFPRELYEKSIRIPFENTTIPVPVCYHTALANHYGNYLVCRKVWGGHDYPYFEKQRENLQAVADFKLPEFTFSKDMLLRPDSKKTYADSLKGMAKECILQLENMYDNLGKCIVNEDFSTAVSILPECQQLAVDLGTLVENVKGEENESTKYMVDKIQTYCDVLFELYNLLVSGGGSEEEISDRVNNIKESLSSLSDAIDKRIINRREVVFFATGPSEWKGFASIYNLLVAKDDVDTYVVPIPVLFKNWFGEILASDDELIKNTHLEDYPEDVNVTLWADFDLGLHHPDRIYIQNPYDGENPCLTVPPQYYAKALREFTDELIYVQPFKTSEFGDEDYTDLATLKYYVTTPGVVYADKILVQSENIRKQYIKKLIEFAGEETKSVWEAKIEVCDFSESVKSDNSIITNQAGDECKDNKKRKLFYLIGLNEMSEQNDIINGIKSRLEIFRENSENVDITFGLYPPDINIWNKVNSKLTKKLIDLLSSCGHEYMLLEPDNDKLEIITAKHDAYYGSPSPLVTIFTYNKKPVMIADYNIQT